MPPCERDGCTVKSASFNWPGEKRGRLCAVHRETGMTDVVHKRCEATGCTVLNPVFNRRGETRGRFCGQHKDAGMEDVVKSECGPLLRAA
jgi:hypothetical protein